MWTRSVPLRDGSGKVVQRVGLSRDVDDRRRAEDSLRHSRDVLDTVFELATVGLTLTDERGRFASHEPAASAHGTGSHVLAAAHHVPPVLPPSPKKPPRRFLRSAAQ